MGEEREEEAIGEEEAKGKEEEQKGKKEEKKKRKEQLRQKTAQDEKCHGRGEVYAQMTVSVIFVDQFSQHRIGQEIAGKALPDSLRESSGGCRSRAGRGSRDRSGSALWYTDGQGKRTAIDHKFYGRKSQDEDRMRNIWSNILHISSYPRRFRFLTAFMIFGVVNSIYDSPFKS